MYLVPQTTLSDLWFFPVRANAVWTSYAHRYKDRDGDRRKHGVKTATDVGCFGGKFVLVSYPVALVVVFRSHAMKRTLGLSVTFGLLSMSLLSIPKIVMAQEMQTPIPPSSEDILGPQLIVWSQQQEPQPVPLTAPQREKAPIPAHPHVERQAVVRTFTGRIVNDHGSYVLIALNDRSYQLDDQRKAKQYGGKQATVTGTLKDDGQRLRVAGIEIIP